MDSRVDLSKITTLTWCFQLNLYTLTTIICPFAFGLWIDVYAAVQYQILERTHSKSVHIFEKLWMRRAAISCLCMATLKAHMLEVMAIEPSCPMTRLVAFWVHCPHSGTWASRGVSMFDPIFHGRQAIWRVGQGLAQRLGKLPRGSTEVMGPRLMSSTMDAVEHV